MFKTMAVAALAALIAGAGTVLAADERLGLEPVVVRLVRDRLVIVPVRIDGSSPQPFLLDTGSSTSIVTPSLAARLRLPRAGSAVQETTTAAHRVALVRASLALGGIERRDLEVLVSSLDTLHDADRTIQGVVGQDLLRVANWSLDYRSKTLVANSEDAGASPLPGERVPLHWQDGRPAVDVRAPDGGTLRLVLDSAATSPILFRDQVRDPMDGAGWARLTTFLGAATVPLVSLGPLRVGAVALAPLVAAVVASVGSARPGEDGLLPTRLFDRIDFDNRGGAVVFNPIGARCGRGRPSATCQAFARTLKPWSVTSGSSAWSP